MIFGLSMPEKEPSMLINWRPEGPQIPQNEKLSIALGFFDGVHTGHGVLLNKAVLAAKEQGIVPAAMTFHIHPQQALTGKPVPMINTAQERACLMKELYGIERLYQIRFDRAFSSLSPEEFFQRYIVNGLHAGFIVTGEDYRFGKGGAGTAEDMKQLCERAGIGCEIMKTYCKAGIPVSSSRIREAIIDGDMALANELLGHKHRVTGTVEKGSKLGRTIGIPTANITLSDGVIMPKKGVYATFTTTPGQQKHLSVTNIGTKPTVSKGLFVNMETHIIDFNEMIYGQKLSIEFMQYLREERPFVNLQALKEQILQDIQAAKELLGHE